MGVFNPSVARNACTGCGECVEACPGEVFEIKAGKSLPVNDDECIGCMSCVEVCPMDAITLDDGETEEISGESAAEQEVYIEDSIQGTQRGNSSFYDAMTTIDGLATAVKKGDASALIIAKAIEAFIYRAGLNIKVFRKEYKKAFPLKYDAYSGFLECIKTISSDKLALTNVIGRLGINKTENVPSVEAPREAITQAGKERIQKTPPRDAEFLTRNGLELFNVDARTLEVAITKSLKEAPAANGTQEDAVARIMKGIDWIRATSCIIANNLAEAQAIGNLPEDDGQEAFAGQLDDIEARLKNREFHVGVVGEFSVGKSTFINAFIEKRCLTEDVIQGTTCSRTLLRHDPEEDVTVCYTDGSIRQMRGKGGVMRSIGRFFGLNAKPLDEKAIKEFLQQVTAVEENAKTIDKVVWQSPLQALENGIVVVDTPGISSQNERHTEVAREAAKDCDALMVLMNLSTGVFSQEVVGEVKKIAGESADKCLFVFTHADQLPDRERRRMEKFIRNKMKSTFGQVRPYWFVSAWEALNELEKGNDGAPKEKLEAFRKFRAEVFEYLVDTRQLLQCRSLADSTAVMLNERKEKLAVAQQTFAARSEELAKTLRGLDERQWGRWRNDLVGEFEARGSEIGEAAVNALIAKLGALRNELHSKINACKDSSDVKSFMKNGLARHFEQFNTVVQKCIQTDLIDEMIKAAKSLDAVMIEEIRKRYQDIEKIFGRSARLDSAVAGEVKANFVAGSSQAGKSAAESLDSNENLAIGGGLAAGAALAMLVPGVGWLVGGAMLLAGGILGSLFVSLDKQKSDARDKVDSILSDVAGKMDEVVAKAHSDSSEKLLEWLNESMDRQEAQYTGYAKAYNDEQKGRAAALSAITARIQGCTDALSIIEANMTQLKETLTGRLALASGEENEQ